MTVYRGVVVDESLLDRECHELMRVRRRTVVDVAEPAPGQPPRWTLVEFEVDGDRAPALAETLQAGLASGPWYVDFNDGDHTYVVFAGRVFSYDRGDADGLDQARAHAQSIGVPPAQIDWAVPW